MSTLIAVVLGFCIDLVVGDPPFLFHPVRAIGWLITSLEKGIRKVLDIPQQKYNKVSHKKMLLGGGLLTLLVISITFGLTYALIWGFTQIHEGLGFGLKVLLSYQILATKSLKVESMKVYDALIKEGLEEARYELSWIVGRDTQQLDEEGVVKATVETVAENTSDGIIAPLLFLMIGGPVLGMTYKAINTMDSMIGYQNERYLYFGRVAAKLDDVVNFIPARLCAYIMMGASFLLGYDAKKAYQIYQRDKYNHKSPNSAHTEAVCAGALGICLAGDAYYFGKKVSKPTIGDALRKVEKEDIQRANRLMYMTSFLSLILFGLAAYGLGIFTG
jgi:adenosylcobinamide-phosphate synthase